MMIIECPKCGTKFRFDEKKITAKGVWARCGRCRNVFFQEKPVAVSELKSPTSPEATIPGSRFDSEQGDVQSNYDGNAVREPVEEADAETEAALSEEPDATRARRPLKNLWTPGKVTAYFAVLIFVLGGISLFVFPDFRYAVIENTPFAGYLGLQVGTGNLSGEGIDFLNVRERFLENRLTGNLMIIQGFAVNRNKFPVSKIKIRVRLLNASGEFIGEAEAYGGVMLTEEELQNLTEKEIQAELNNPYGRNVTNSDIPPEGNIPFMVVLHESPSNAVEYIVEPAELEKR